jgi:ribose/xylose/arabinose/galactoside ABC-type transport system permease subunit
VTEPTRRVPAQAIAWLTLALAMALLLAWRGQFAAFLSGPNLRVLLHANSSLAVVALGMLLIILSGGIDLSVGSVVALVMVVTMRAYLLVYNGPEFAVPEDLVPWLRERGWLWAGGKNMVAASLAAVAAGLATGGLCGLCNGLVITRLRLAPFVATLGMISVARGLAVWLAGRGSVTFLDARPGWVDALAQSRPYLGFLIPSTSTAALLAVAVAVLLSRTVFGRYVYAIGANEAAAWRGGIATDRVKLRTYALAGLLFGWAGVLSFAYESGGNANAMVGLELEAIAAVVIGGASLSGGRGTVLGAMLGVVLIGVLTNVVSLLGVPVELKNILVGVIIVAGMAVSNWRRGE